MALTRSTAIDQAVILAHASGGAGTGGVPRWLVVYGSGLVVLLVYLAARATFRTPRLAATTERVLPDRLQRFVAAGTPAAGAVGVAFFALTAVAGLFGSVVKAQNIAGIGLLVIFWLVTIVLSGLLGNVYSVLNPLVFLGSLIPSRVRLDARTAPVFVGPMMVFTFVWYDLAYFDPYSPRNCGVFIVAYTVIALAGRVVWGSEWLLRDEGFAMLFRTLGRVGIFGRGPDGRIVVRRFARGLVSTPLRRGEELTLVVVAGALAFDALAKLPFWITTLGVRRGWSRTALNSVALVWVVAALYALWYVASRRSHWATPALAPLIVGITLGHYWSMLVIELQNAYAQMSDPLGHGWNLFGTIDFYGSQAWLAPTVITYVQGITVTLAGSLAVVVVHDRAIANFGIRKAISVELATIMCVLGACVGGLSLILGG